MDIPVFLITGFLESGKTDLINYTVKNDDFSKKGSTLIIVCEQGVEEYNEKALNSMFINIEYIEDEKDFTMDKLQKLAEAYDPDRIILEYNGTWQMKTLPFPKNWYIGQQVTVIDATTFNVYFQNMRQLFFDMIKLSNMVIVNRAEKHDLIPSMKRSIKSINPNCDVLFEDKNGQVNDVMDEDLPYDVKSQAFEINDDDFGIFYVDSLENSKRYDGKIVTFTAMAANVKGLEPAQFMLGRMAMTCCADDMSYFGILCYHTADTVVRSQDWFKVTGKITYEFSKYFNSVGPYLKITSIAKTDPIKKQLTL